MEATIKIESELLNMDVVEGIKKMFPNKKLSITIQEAVEEEEVEIDRNSPTYIEGDEDATQFILNRPALALELQSRIDSIENKTAKLVTVNPKELLCD